MRYCFFKLFPVIGIFFFVSSVFFTILFAEGYNYDPAAKNFVKQGIIVFESIPEGSNFLLDKELIPFSSSLELRILPGWHEIEIQGKMGYRWRKNVFVTLDQVLRFPPIKFLYDVEEFFIPLEPLVSWQLKETSTQGVRLINPWLHVEKYYFLTEQLRFFIKDVLSKSLNPENPLSIEKFLQNTESIYREGEHVYYIQGRTLFHYNLKQKKVLQEVALPESVIWLSRISDTFHFFFLTKEKFLWYCDEDFENCISFGKLDTPFIQASEDRTIFMATRGGRYVKFSLGTDSFFGPLLDHFVSGVFG